MAMTDVADVLDVLAVTTAPLEVVNLAAVARQPVSLAVVFKERPGGGALPRRGGTWSGSHSRHA